MLKQTRLPDHFCVEVIFLLKLLLCVKFLPDYSASYLRRLFFIQMHFVGKMQSLFASGQTLPLATPVLYRVKYISISVKRERYFSRLQEPTTEPDVSSPSRTLFFYIRSTIFLPSALGLPCNLFPSPLPRKFCMLPEFLCSACVLQVHSRTLIILGEDYKFRSC